jgi:hypothetical protein
LATSCHTGPPDHGFPLKTTASFEKKQDDAGGQSGWRSKPNRGKARYGKVENKSADYDVFLFFGYFFIFFSP